MYECLQWKSVKHSLIFGKILSLFQLVTFLPIQFKRIRLLKNRKRIVFNFLILSTVDYAFACKSGKRNASIRVRGFLSLSRVRKWGKQRARVHERRAEIGQGKVRRYIGYVCVYSYCREQVKRSRPLFAFGECTVCLQFAWIEKYRGGTYGLIAA